MIFFDISIGMQLLKVQICFQGACKSPKGAIFCDPLPIQHHTLSKRRGRSCPGKLSAGASSSGAGCRRAYSAGGGQVDLVMQGQEPQEDHCSAYCRKKNRQLGRPWRKQTEQTGTDHGSCGVKIAFEDDRDRSGQNIPDDSAADGGHNTA